ncbi:MAG TPA: aminoglycoside phosphotransferase [Jiangellaceae bacterium]|nr:aminoglycoside phosphotransferase [Jiangellaceae bacterium]
MNIEAAVSLLSPWLPHQRWFAGKNAPVDTVRTVNATRLREAEPEVWHLLVEVVQGERRETYQVPVSFREVPDGRLEHVLVGETEGRYVYDALHDKDATGELLRRFEIQDRVDGLAFHTEPGAELPLGEPSLVLTAEQSNTSLAYGDAALLKVFRRVVPGVNPDIEIHDALTRAGNEFVAPMLGWLDGSWVSLSGERLEAGLAMLQTFLVTATDGWAIATTSVRDLYAEADLHADEVGGDFAGEAQRLGLATAEVHSAMAEVLPTRTFRPEDLRALAERMRSRLEAAVTTVPELTPYAPGLVGSFDRLAELHSPVPVQRIHGDLHLGQVVRTVVGWKLVDFEGEPAKPLAERVALDSPIRDVAAMLRSFDYAARHLLVIDHPGSEQIAYRAAEWAERNRAAFCEGYAKAAGHDPREEQVLLRAYETDKVVYEAVYEARNRPDWLAIPLAGAENLATDPDAR